ncbi:MAG: BTAD domain-containing putative transcriptional regulator, partial [Actinomycetota bacterium]
MEYRVLGPFEVVAGGRAIDLGTAKQRSLLALLLLETGRVVSGDRLADLLWNGDPPAQAMGTLQAYASKLRRALEPDREARTPSAILVTVHPGYALRVSDDDIDAARFERLLGEGRAAAAVDPERAAALLDEALALWRGTQALADLTAVDALRQEAARLEELRLSATEDRIELDVALGRHAPAVADLERLVAEHPLRERLRSLLMLALHRSGRQGEALQVFNDAREHLADTLGLDPGPALRRLEEELRAGVDVAPVATAVRDRPASEERTTAPPIPDLIGRDRELGVLADGLHQVVARRSAQVIVVDGEPGVGKTRLAEALTATAATAHGALVAWGRCLEGEDTPAFWPWREICRGVVGSLDDQELTAIADARLAPVAQLVPDLARRVDTLPSQPSLGGEADRFRMYDAAATLLARTAANRPVVAVIDDIQAADAATLHLLRFLASAPPEAPLLVVATRRAGEGDEEMQATLADLARHPAASRLELRGLDDDAAAALAAAVADGHGDPEILHDVVSRAGGNPFFVTELVRLHRDERGVGGHALVPAGVRDVLRRRLLRLDPAVVETLTIAAVVGREFDLDVVE